jgi:mono/diheme cytochrome c family protein
VIAFLDWCGKVNLQGFPAKPPLQALMRPTSTTASAGPPQPELFRTICVACHAVGGVGGVVGPPLDEVHKRKTREEMVTWISDPQRLKPGTPMPKIDMTPEQLNEVVDYLLSLAGTASTPRAQTPTAAPTQSLNEIQVSESRLLVLRLGDAPAHVADHLRVHHGIRPDRHGWAA